MNLISKLKMAGSAAAAAFILASCSSSAENSPAFIGVIEADSIGDMIFNYAPDHDMIALRTIEIVPDSTGHFTFPDSLVSEGGLRTQLLIDNDYFGIYLEKGKNVEGKITRGADGKLAISFSGDNTDINTFYNALCQAFDSMRYFSPDPGEGPSLDEYFSILEKENKEVCAKLPSIKDEETRKFYEKMTDRMYTWTKLRLIMDRADENESDVREDPEYVALVKTIDPNDDMSLECTLIFPWLNMQTKSDRNDPLAHCIEQLHIVDKQITNPNTHKVMMNQLAYYFFAYSKPSPGQAEAFMKEYSKVAAKYPELIARYNARKGSIKEIHAGDAIAFDPTLISPDGKTCRLSDLKGKVTYIDFWATWCGPCCKQIPFLEKLVEKMKGNPDVAFISISSDSDKEAWLAKIKKDNPSWPQYILDTADGDKFFQTMNITGIPRFMILNADGTVAVPEAGRPSDAEATEAQILECVK